MNRPFISLVLLSIAAATPLTGPASAGERVLLGCPSITDQRVYELCRAEERSLQDMQDAIDAAREDATRDRRNDAIDDVLDNWANGLGEE